MSFVNCLQNYLYFIRMQYVLVICTYFEGNRPYLEPVDTFSVEPLAVLCCGRAQLVWHFH